MNLACEESLPRSVSSIKHWYGSIEADSVGESPDSAFRKRIRHMGSAQKSNLFRRQTGVNNSNGMAGTDALKYESGSDEYDFDELDCLELEGDREGISFIPKQTLPQPSTQEMTIEQLMKLLNSPYMELDPEYQRDVVWTTSRMSGLIDSMIQNFYVPPVIFNKLQVFEDDGTLQWKRICVDGKQRLSSIKAFVEGRIPCRDKDNRKWFFCQPSSSPTQAKRKRKPRILPDSVRKEFLRKRIVCVETINLRRDQEEDLFARVQLGMPLTNPEKMRATSGEWQKLARLYEDDFKEIADCKFGGLVP